MLATIAGAGAQAAQLSRLVTSIFCWIAGQVWGLGCPVLVPVLVGFYPHLQSPRCVLWSSAQGWGASKAAPFLPAWGPIDLGSDRRGVAAEPPVLVPEKAKINHRMSTTERVKTLVVICICVMTTFPFSSNKFD